MPAGRRRRSRLRLRRNRCGPRYGSGKAVRQWRGRRGSGESIAAGPERPLARVLRPIRSMAQNARKRSEEHTSELQSLMRISYAVFCLKKKKNTKTKTPNHHKDTHSNKTNHNSKP